MTDLIVTDKNYRPIDIIDGFKSLMWFPRYYEDGSFELHTDLKHKDLLRNNKYIYRNDKKDVGVIRKFECKDGRITITGCFLTKEILEKRAVRGTFARTNITAEQFMRDLVSTFCGDLVELGEYHGLGSIITSKQVTGKSVNERLRELAIEQELGYRIYYDYDREKAIFEVYQGLDKTLSQDKRSWVVASDNWDNVLSEGYSIDDSDYKNYAVVDGQVYRRKIYYWVENAQGEMVRRFYWESFRATTDVDQTNGEDRKELYVDARDIDIEIVGTDDEGDDIMEPLNDYFSKLVQRGREKLADRPIIVNVDLDIMPIEGLELGDKITYQNDNLSLTYDSRVIAEDEVFEKGEEPLRRIFVGKEKLTIKKLIARSVF